VYLKAAQLAEAMQTAVTPDQPSSRTGSPDAEMGISHGIFTMTHHMCNMGRRHDASVSPPMNMCLGVCLCLQVIALHEHDVQLAYDHASVTGLQQRLHTDIVLWCRWRCMGQEPHNRMLSDTIC